MERLEQKLNEVKEAIGKNPNTEQSQSILALLKLQSDVSNKLSSIETKQKTLNSNFLKFKIF